MTSHLRGIGNDFELELRISRIALTVHCSRDNITNWTEWWQIFSKWQSSEQSLRSAWEYKHAPRAENRLDWAFLDFIGNSLFLHICCTNVGRHVTYIWVCEPERTSIDQSDISMCQIIATAFKKVFVYVPTQYGDDKYV